MPYYKNIIFQEFLNKRIENIILFQDSLNTIIILILSFITAKISFRIYSNNLFFLNSRKERNFIEIFWTFTPSFIILIISFPSLISLYLNEERKINLIELQISGNQWYWTYKRKNFRKINSYIYPSYINRNIRTDYSIILPTKNFIKLIISSNDVIHSWTIPSLITKNDAIPGRLNISRISSIKRIKRKGQCSEICGINHSFIPISILFLKFSSINLKEIIF